MILKIKYLLYFISILLMAFLVIIVSGQGGVIIMAIILVMTAIIFCYLIYVIIFIVEDGNFILQQSDEMINVKPEQMNDDVLLSSIRHRILDSLRKPNLKQIYNNISTTDDKKEDVENKTPIKRIIFKRKPNDNDANLDEGF